MSSNPKERLRAVLSGQAGGPLLNEWEAFAPVFNDPVNQYLRAHRKEGQITVDRFGAEFAWPLGQIGGTPHITKDNKAVPDITKWREALRVPDLAANCTDWAAARETKAGIDREGRRLSMAMMAAGLFEQLHALMGFEDTLTNFIRRPREMMELCEVLGEYRLTFARLLVENLRPDVILSHDDWGTKTRLFMSPKCFRQFLKPQYMKLYRYLKEQGVMIMHHSDSYAETLVEDMVEMGVDIWQGALPSNDIVGILDRRGGRLAIMGGIDAAIVDRADSTEAEIRAEVRRACREYDGRGGFIPAMTYGAPDSYLFPHVQRYVIDEIDRYNQETHS